MSSAVEVTYSTSSPEVVDLEALLAPMPGENPAGESLQYSGLYDEIREARRTEDNLEQGDWKRDVKVADWDRVIKLATDALASKTKDLQICAWLAEAIVKTQGFAGLREGLKLTRGLLERYWDCVYPEIDEGELEGRANSLAWMDRQLALAIRELPITSTIGGVQYSYTLWEESQQFDVPDNFDQLEYDQQQRVSEVKERAAREGKLTSEDWRRVKNATRRAFYEEINGLLDESWNVFQALDRVMDEKFADQTPGLGDIKKSLENTRMLVERLVKEKRVLEPDPVSEAGTTEAGVQTGGVVGGPVFGGTAGPIRTRQEALSRLSEIAEYFRKTEPHSPVSYIVQRAVKWGDMPLEVWLRDVIKDNSVLDYLRETLGLNTGSDASS